MSYNREIYKLFSSDMLIISEEYIRSITFPGFLLVTMRCNLFSFLRVPQIFSGGVGVVCSTETESEEHFYFLLILLMTPVADPVKTGLSKSQAWQKRKNRPITMLILTPSECFLHACDYNNFVSLDDKRWVHKRNLNSAYDSVGLIIIRSLHCALLITTLTLWLVKTSFFIVLSAFYLSLQTILLLSS